MPRAGKPTTPPPEGLGPRRTCVGCRTTRPAAELVRVARTADGSLVFGRTLPGRGAWLCRDGLVECSERAATRGGFDRAFRCRVSPASLDALRRAIAVEAGKSDIRFVPGSPPARD